MFYDYNIYSIFVSIKFWFNVKFQHGFDITLKKGQAVTHFFILYGTTLIMINLLYIYPFLKSIKFCKIVSFVVVISFVATYTSKEDHNFHFWHIIFTDSVGVF